MKPSSIVPLVGLLLVAPAVGSSAVRQGAGAGSAACIATPSSARFPFTAPVTGDGSIGIVDGSLGRWSAGPTKTLWILPRDLGPVTITGRRLDGDGALRFQLDRSRAPLPVLRFDTGRERGVQPQGASDDELARHLFRPSYVHYASPGCWEIAVASGSGTTRIVLQQR